MIINKRVRANQKLHIRHPILFCLSHNEYAIKRSLITFMIIHQGNVDCTTNLLIHLKSVTV